MKINSQNEIAIAYIDGIFEILTLLNEDNHGREFFIQKLSKDKNPKESLVELIGKECHIVEEKIDDFYLVLEKIYERFCQNYLYKTVKLLGVSKDLSETKKISSLYSDELIKKLFVSSLDNFFAKGKKINEVRVEINELPYNGFIIEFDTEYYYLHFEIT